MQYKFLQREFKQKKKENAAPLNAPRNGCSSKLSDRNDFPGKNARERRDLAKHRRILIIRVREKRGGEKKKKESRKKKRKERAKRSFIPENTDVFAKLVNSGSCREGSSLNQRGNVSRSCSNAAANRSSKYFRIIPNSVRYENERK